MTLEAQKSEARELLKQIERLSQEEKRIILASLKGMLIVADAQQEEKKGA